MKSRSTDRENKPAGTAGLAAAKACGRSRVTNGSVLIAGVDGRSRGARRWRDLFRHYMDETGGRHDQLCRALASLIVQREMLDAALARGELIDALGLVRLCGQINRTMARLGLVTGESDDARARREREDREAGLVA